MPKKRSTLAKRVNRLERTCRPEVKYQSDESSEFDAIGAIQGTVLHPQRLAEGMGRNQRVGDKVKSRNIRFQAIMKMPDGASNSTCAVRILALRSKFTDPNTGTIDTGDFPNFYSTVDEDKFFVLKDILTQVSLRTLTVSSSSSGSTMRKVKFNLPTGLRKLQYDGPGNQSPSNNEIVVFLVAENGSAEVAYNWQHYYIDN